MTYATKPRKLTRDRLCHLLICDPVVGKCWWRGLPSLHASNIKIGDEAGNVSGRGYRVVVLDGSLYSRSHLIWFFVHGRWPQQIDHRNGVRNDDRIENLRECTASQNGANCGLSKRNKSGVKGVSYHTARKRWIATIAVPHTGNKFLGRFKTKEEAQVAYLGAAAELHGDFRREIP